MNLSSFGRRWITLADVATAGAALRSYFDTIYTGAGTAYTPGGADVAVADGGTGVSSLTAYALLAGGTTSTNPVQSLAGVGTSPQVLTSNGPGALPTFQTLTVDYGAGNAALAYGAIGTYVIASKSATTGFVANSTYAGSTLKPAGFGATDPALAADTASSNVTVAYGGSALSGTWRAMGQVNYTPALSTDLLATLFLRIS